MKYFYDNEDRVEYLTCEICMEPYSKDKKSKILKCGHTFCEECIKSCFETTKKCFSCNAPLNIDEKEKEKENKIVNDLCWDNNIIDKLSEFCECLNIDVNKFLSFPFSFKYCENCSLIITNYSYNKHKIRKHKISCFNKILKLFFEKNKNISNKDIVIEPDKKYNKYLICVVYYYQSYFLPKIKYFEVKKSFSIKNEGYKFYGQFLINSEKYFFSNLIRKDKNEKILGKWHKGVLINIKKRLVIHGYFCFKVDNNEYDLIWPIFGLLNWNDITFFGFFRIIDNMNEDKINIENIKFENGLLYNNKEYYFGEFGKNIDPNGDDNNIKKIKGEIISLKGKEIEIIPDLPPIINQPEQKPSEPNPLESNPTETNPPKPNFKIEFYFDKPNDILTEINVIDNEVNNEMDKNISIFPLVKFDKNNYSNSKLLENCKIELYNDKVNLIVQSENTNSFVIFDSKNKNNCNDQNLKEGFLFELNEEKGKNNLIILKSFTFTKNDINDSNEIFNILNEIINITIDKCIIKCYYYEIKDNIYKRKKEIQIEFENISNLNRNNKRKKDKKIISIDDIKEKTTIKNLFNKLFVENKKEEENISCGCLAI
jgi:hypothetical protein